MVTYLDIVTEMYDLSDPYTLNSVVCCNEGQKDKVLEHLALNLYNDIVNNVTEINFGSIPNSKGDITKVENYEQLVECVKNMSKLISAYGQSTYQIDVVNTAMNNIQKRTDKWKKAYNLNIETAKIIYNTITLACIASISLLITSCIEYVKSEKGTINTAFDKAAYVKTRDHVMFKSLESFNKACSDGTLDKLIDESIKNNITKVKEQYDPNYGMEIQYFHEVVGAIATVFGLILMIKPMLILLLYAIRSLSYYFFKMRQDTADFFNVQADFLQINAENIKYREDITDGKKDIIYKRQMKWVDRFRKYANFWMIKDKRAQNETKAYEEDAKRQKYVNAEPAMDTGGDSLF